MPANNELHATLFVPGMVSLIRNRPVSMKKLLSLDLSLTENPIVSLNIPECEKILVDSRERISAKGTVPLNNALHQDVFGRKKRLVSENMFEPSREELIRGLIVSASS